MVSKTKLLAGVFVLIGLFGAGYYVADTDQANLYQCDEIVGLCFKLSKVNDAGLQTRCYYNESAPTKYKICKEGWVKSELVNITGTETQLPDLEVYQIQTQFTNKQEAESYITTLKSEVSFTYNIVAVTQEPYNNEINVHWMAKIMKGEDLVHRELLSSKITETATKEEIKGLVDKHANDWFERWKPAISIRRSDKIV